MALNVAGGVCMPGARPVSYTHLILSSRIVPYEEIIRRIFYVVLCHLGFFVLIQTVGSYGLLPVHLMGTFYICLLYTSRAYRRHPPVPAGTNGV